MMEAGIRKKLFEQEIAGFINKRRDEKLKGKTDEDAGATAAKYDYHTWIADAAKRISQIQAVTHVLKATHPDARGTSLHINPTTLSTHQEVGSHLLGGKFADDIVGNAAALDVYKFLKLEVEGKRLLDWLQQDDADLLAALHPDPATNQEWATAFKALIRAADTLVSHPLAKQVYWCVTEEPNNNEGFHLLQPLFASSFAHAVHQDINDARFGEESKAARQSRFKEVSHPSGYGDYRNLVVRKLGGTKPQNISQLNSERGGVNYLLSSLPPSWEQDRPRNFLFIDSALECFRRYEDVDSLLKALTGLLKSDLEATMETRSKREAIEQRLGESLAAFGLAAQQLFEPGWTRNPDCRLPLCEKIWLDPDRSELPNRLDHEEDDAAFQQANEWQDWPGEIATRFGNWLNAILKGEGLPVGDAEHKNWAKQAIEWSAPAQRRVQKLQEVANG